MGARPDRPPTWGPPTLGDPTVRGARPTTAALLLAAGLLLAGCGGGDDGASAPVGSAAGSSAASGSAAAPSPSAGPSSLEFPEGSGLPTLTVPDGARVIPYTVGDAQNFEVTDVDRETALQSFQDQLQAAGFDVVRNDSGGLVSVQASMPGAGTVLVTGSSTGVTVIGTPPS